MRWAAHAVPARCGLYRASQYNGERLLSSEKKPDDGGGNVQQQQVRMMQIEASVNGVIRYLS
jgi:hypothetical protein